jgi:hypothetical protein
VPEQVGDASSAERHTGETKSEAHDAIDRARTRESDAWRESH